MGASGKSLKQPIKVPRPKDRNKGKRQQQGAPEATDAAYKKGIGVLAATSRPRR